MAATLAKALLLGDVVAVSVVVGFVGVVVDDGSMDALTDVILLGHNTVAFCR
jgi:hypothetical protein